MGLFEGRRALVTGGASGIGLATAERLASEGARVAVLDLHDEPAAQAAARVDGIGFACDVADAAAVTETFTRAAGELGGLDIVHLNAGVTTGEGDITKLTEAQYRRIMGANVDGVVYGTRAAVRIMSKDGGGAIVATASLAGLIAYPPDPIYGLTKHAVVGFVRALGPSLEPHGITLNAVCPGIVETPLVGEQAAGRLREAGFPMLRAEDIAEAVVRAVTSGGTGQCWAIQPGREALPYEFRGVPGPRTPGAEGRVPPAVDLQREGP